MSPSVRSVAKAAGIYASFAALIYWPVLFGLRFFWEDFTNQEYPIRDFAFTSIRWLHHIPLWNPYSWAWASFSADPQSAMWYPGNLLEILVTRFLVPTAQHLPVLVPEIFGILHLPLGALGCFVLARHRYKLDFFPALLVGFLWGFGVRMVAEQNHPMTVEQWLWLPWCAYFMLRSIEHWRLVFAFALVLGTSFLLGQPQISLFNCTFLGCWLIYELWLRWKSSERLAAVLRSAAIVAVGFALAASISAVQYLSSIGLSKASSRAHLTFQEAGNGSITFGHLVNFFVPRILGEYPSEEIGGHSMIGGDQFYWESAFSWTVLGELLTIYAFWRLWKKRREQNAPHTRELFFFSYFGIFALLFGLGYHLGFQWIFWKFVPLFDRIRAPSRMLMYLTFGGALYAGIGMQLLIEEAESRARTARFFAKALIPFIVFGVLGTLGVFSLFVSEDRGAVWQLSLPTLIVSVLVLLFLRTVRKEEKRNRQIAFIGVLVLVELFYNGITWHRNSVDPQQLFENAERSKAGKFASQNWKNTTTKLLAAHGDSSDIVRNAGMYFRAPIETAGDSISMRLRNPMRLNRSMVPGTDLLLDWKIMGVSAIFDTIHGPQITTVGGALPFLKLYDRWVPGASDSVTSKILDSNFDYRTTAIIEGANTSSVDTSSRSTDSITSSHIAEDSITCTVSTTKPSMLLVNDLYYKRWIATVDGKQVPILRAFSALRAVPIERAGTHQIVMYYDDSLLKLGGMISISAFLISLIGAVIGWIRSRKDQTAGFGAGGGNSRA